MEPTRKAGYSLLDRVSPCQLGSSAEPASPSKLARRFLHHQPRESDCSKWFNSLHASIWGWTPPALDWLVTSLKRFLVGSLGRASPAWIGCWRQSEIARVSFSALSHFRLDLAITTGRQLVLPSNEWSTNLEPTNSSKVQPCKLSSPAAAASTRNGSAKKIIKKKKSKENRYEVVKWR